MVKYFLPALAIMAAVTACVQAVAVNPAPLTVQIRPSHGVPQLLVNGVPTIPRFFYGGPGWVPLRIKPGERQVSFDFTAIDSDKTAEMDIRFDPAPGTIILSGFHIVDIESKKNILPLTNFDATGAFANYWGFSPSNQSNTAAKVELAPGGGHGGTAGIEVTLKAPRHGVWLDTHIYHRGILPLRKGRRYHVDFWVKSDAVQALSIVFYRPMKDMPLQIVGSANEPFFSQIQMAAESEVNFITFPTPLLWIKPGQTVDFSYIDAVCDYILAANPQALLVPRINVNAPIWWLDVHPDDEMRWQGKKKNQGRAATVASAVYRQEANAMLTKLIEHLEAKYGNHMAGYHVAGGNSNEWFYEDSHSAATSGYAPADLVSWREWLTKRYVTDKALQEAWRNTAVTLKSVQVPTDAARRATPDGIFRDPVKERTILDWNQYQQDVMADTICELAHTVRIVTRGRKLVIFFYGYLFEFADMQMGSANTGHFALRKVLDSPDIDVLCAPISYYDRNTGGSAPAMSAAESVALAGKLWIMEDDLSTYLSLPYINPPGSNDRTHSLGETNQVLLRNDAEVTLRNMGTWWMDLTKNGWFNDPGMWASLDRFRPVEEKMLHLDQAFRPEIAVVIDEKNMLLLTPRSHPVGHSILASLAAFGRVGAPYGQYLQDDVAAGRVPDAKLYVFLDAWRLTAEERSNLLRQTQGKMRFWGYASGIFDNDKPSLDAVKELTGFQVKVVTPASTLVTPTKAGNRLGLKTPLQGVEKYGPLAPILAVTNARRGEILATFPDGSTAIALHQSSSGISLFCGTPVLTPELLRMAAKLAGVHLYTKTDAVIYANGPFLAIHGTQDGSLALDTGHATAVINALTGEMVGHGPTFDSPMKRGQTVVLKYSFGVARKISFKGKVN